MNITIKKIEAMHKRFGKLEGKKCGDCCNLVFHQQGKKYFKCALYGTSSSLSTDWVKNGLLAECLTKSKNYVGREHYR
jgi:hypothetical protein